MSSKILDDIGGGGGLETPPAKENQLFIFFRQNVKDIQHEKPFLLKLFCIVTPSF